MERLIRLDEVKTITSLSESDIARRIKLGVFPKSVRIGPKRVAWVLSEVNDWVSGVTGKKKRKPSRNVFEYDPGNPYCDRIIKQADGCWLWTGANNGRYGISVDPKTKRVTTAHRVLYEHFKGPIPDGLEVDHLCRVKLCVNPDHLEPVTSKENMRRANAHPRKLKTHCKRGHEYTPENTVINKRGNRHCKQCAKLKYEERKNSNAND